MNKKEMISLILIVAFFYTGCSKEQKDTKTEYKTNHIEVNTSDDKPLKLPF